MQFYEPDQKMSMEKQIEDVMHKANFWHESVFALICGVRVVVTRDMKKEEIIKRVNKMNCQHQMTIDKFVKEYGG